jgi:hypothetical protein
MNSPKELAADYRELASSSLSIEFVRVDGSRTVSNPVALLALCEAAEQMAAVVEDASDSTDVLMQPELHRSLLAALARWQGVSGV